MMQLLDQLTASLLAPLDGYKAKAGSWVFVALAINAAFPVFGPTVAAILNYLGYALVAYGLRDALDTK